MVTRINVDLPAGLKERLVAEAKLQRRSHRAIVEMALERYLDDMAAGRGLQKLVDHLEDLATAEPQPTAQS